MRCVFLLLLATQAVAQNQIGEMDSPNATVRGSVVLTNNKALISSGSQINATQNPASLKLVRGGEIKVCPQSAITITASASGKENLIGLNSGALETHYSLSSNSDAVMTPDFRIQLAGPGEFDFAIGVNPKGDTCVKSLPGNTSAVIVSELLGDGTHQVKPGEDVLFRAGHVDAAESNTSQSCGCPVSVPTKVATELGFPEQQSQNASAAIAAGQPLPQVISALPAGVISKPGQVYMRVDAPIVFHGEPPADTAPPLPTLVARTNLLPDNWVFPFSEAQPPVKPAKTKKGWFHKLGSAFASIFK